MTGRARALAAIEGRHGGDTSLRVDRRTVQQEIVDRLRQAILSGRFQPGDRLVEVDLCAALGVSRPSLREALRSLHAERLVELIPNRGPQIPVLSWEEAEQIYQVRSLLEGEAAALCARNVDAAGVEALERALDDFRLAVEADDAARRVEATSAFYTLMLRFSGNRVIDDLLTGLLARINQLRARSMSRHGRSKQSYREMSAILAAIRKHDAEAARRAAQRHVARAHDAAAKVFGESTP